MTHNAQTGRSMIEMLAVIAIIGILSVITFWGYEMAMARYRANEVIKNTNMFALSIENQFELGTDEGELEPGEEEEEFDLSEYQPNNEAYPNIQIAGYAGSFEVSDKTTAFEVTLTDIEKAVCDKIMNSGWDQPYMIYVNNTPNGTCEDSNAMIFAFNNTLDTEAPACNPGSVWDDDAKRCLNCEADKYQNGDSCSDCPAGATASPGSTDCVCPDGSVWNKTTKACDDCEAGMYGKDHQCKKCPKGADTDVGPGATECNCPTGSDWNKYVETCEPPSCDTYVDCPASANYVACVEHLCKEYIPVEYIQSDGTQYFDTGVTGNQDTEITVTAARIDSNGYYKYSQLAGWFKTGSNESITINVNNTDYNNGVCRFNGIASSQGAAKVFHANPGHAITYSISRNGMVQGNATVDTFSGVGTFTTSSTLCLLKSCGTSGTERPWRLYGAQFTNTQPTDRDFKPVKDEDGKGCLYDVVTHEPLYHLGGGTMGIGEF